MLTPTQKRKRLALDISQKLEIIEKYNGHTKPEELGAFYNVNPSTISTIVASKQQERLLQHEESKAKRIRTSNFEEVEVEQYSDR
ncbi:hypothetical protein BpHYR1_000659 [Brachionus plicatilis]|uniref:HTH psq-type domain-containing protein n=1 Tax=Brachionus plicatilis TaxID=10195 RepID=A0A3M7SH63_BRAPC|nr:hypothetical protein BpHYR1_000659 [Brachionus plicatilis]